MRSVVGPLLFGLIPLIAVGCALPDRSLTRSEDLRFRPKGLPNSRGTQFSASNGTPEFGSPMTIRDSVQNEIDTSSSDSGKSINLVNFKAEKRVISPQKFAAGHSFDIEQSTDVVESDAVPSPLNDLSSTSRKLTAKQDKAVPTSNRPIIESAMIKRSLALNSLDWKKKSLNPSPLNLVHRLGMNQQRKVRQETQTLLKMNHRGQTHRHRSRCGQIARRTEVRKFHPL